MFAKKNQLILHIGTEKTGTTSIQNWLAENAEVLRKDDVYPLMPDSTGNYRPLAAAFSPIDEYFLSSKSFSKEEFQFARYALRDEIKSNLENELANAQGSKSQSRVFIISSEHLSSRVVLESDLVELRRFLRAIFKKVSVLVYLRDQATMAEAAWSTSVRSGNPAPLEIAPSDRTKLNPYFNHSILLRNWSQVFGKRNLKVVNFTKIRDSGETGVIGHFKQILEKSVDNEIRGTKDSIGYRNTSIDYKSALLLQYFNETVDGLYLPSGGINESAEGLRRRFDNFVSQRQILGVKIRTDREAWKRAFSSSNSLVAEEFPEVGELFPEDADFYVDSQTEERRAIELEIEGIKILFGRG